MADSVDNQLRVDTFIERSLKYDNRLGIFEGYLL